MQLSSVQNENCSMTGNRMAWQVRPDPAQAIEWNGSFLKEVLIDGTKSQPPIILQQLRTPVNAARIVVRCTTLAPHQSTCYLLY